MIKVFLLSLLYFVSCQNNCFLTLYNSKPENCYQRNASLGSKCCFYKFFIKYNGETLISFGCTEFPKEYTDEMIKTYIDENLKFSKDYVTYQTSCP